MPEPNNTNTFTPYIIVDGPPTSRLPLISYLDNTKNPAIGPKTDYPLKVVLGGATGAGKTVLATLYAKETGIGYDPVELAKEAGIKLDGAGLRRKFRLEGDKRIYVTAIPKITTREPRSNEISGLDFYFFSQEDLQKLGKGVLFMYRYPPSEEGNQYAMPTSLLMPLKHGVDSIITMTGYEPFGIMLERFPDAVCILVDADSRDIEAHIKGRSASSGEREIRLGSFSDDRQRFYESRHLVPYSVFIDSLKSLRVDITPDTEGRILRELGTPFKQLKAIVKWERLLREKGVDVRGNPQRSFDYFLDHVVKKLFNGMPYEELQKRLELGPVPIIDAKNDGDAKLLETYSGSGSVSSRSLLENIVRGITAIAALDANGRRTIVLSPYGNGSLSDTGGSEKRVIIELLKQKLNGLGAYLASESPATYKPFSLLSLLNFEEGVDEGLLVYLTSEHVPPYELERPRELNIVFSNTTNGAKPLIHVPNLDELIQIREGIGGDPAKQNIFFRAIRYV